MRSNSGGDGQESSGGGAGRGERNLVVVGSVVVGGYRMEWVFVWLFFFKQKAAFGVRLSLVGSEKG